MVTWLTIPSTCSNSKDIPWSFWGDFQQTQRLCVFMWMKGRQQISCAAWPVTLDRPSIVNSTPLLPAAPNSQWWCHWAFSRAPPHRFPAEAFIIYRTNHSLLPARSDPSRRNCLWVTSPHRNRNPHPHPPACHASWFSSGAHSHVKEGKSRI